jgi:hypothetical protein
VLEGDDPFENDGHFIHKVAPVSLDQWASQWLLFLLTRLWSCILFGCQFQGSIYKTLQLLSLIWRLWPKDSGKSGLDLACRLSLSQLKSFGTEHSTLVGFVKKVNE